MAGNQKRTTSSTRDRPFPFLRAAFFLLALFAVVVPFTSIPERFTTLGTEWIEAFRGRDPRPRPVRAEPPPRQVSQSPAPKPGKKPGKPLVRKDDSTPEPKPKKTAKPPGPPKPKPKPQPQQQSAVTQLPTELEFDALGDVREMSRGLQLRTDIQFKQGGLATALRGEEENYRAELTLRVALPEPAKNIAALKQANPQLDQALPDLPELLKTAKVSPFYYQLFENKQKRLKRQSTKLARLLTRHNFYDCQTLLELRHPRSKRRALLIQGDMDVVSDGSDGDRLPKMPEEIVNSTFYQPFTSYGWKKTTGTPNPMVKGWEQRIRNADAEIKDPETTAARRKWLKDRKAYLKRGIADMKARSFLIAEYDPFIVVPVNLLTYRGKSLAPNTGDYAVVFHKGKAYPAIVGDAGPSFKVGEASLRLAKEIDPKANPYRRPVSDLSVTYLVFPGTAESPKRAPDYKLWHRRCQALLKDFGGLGGGFELHQWKDLLEPEPARPAGPGEASPETDAGAPAPDPATDHTGD